MSSARMALPTPQFLDHRGMEVGLGREKLSVWSAGTLRKRFISQHLFGIEQIGSMITRALQTEKSWFAIHLKSGLMKPRRGIPQTLCEEGKTGGGQASIAVWLRPFTHKAQLFRSYPIMRTLTTSIFIIV